MEPIEIIFIVVMSVLIFASLWSFILAAAFGTGKTVKIVFCVVSALSLCVNIFLVLLWTGIIPSSQMGTLFELRTTIFAPILAFVLTVIASSEFAGLFLMPILMPNKRRAKTKEEQPAEKIITQQENFVPDNERKAGERKHTNYKIVGVEE